jgi:ribosomal protein L29
MRNWVHSRIQIALDDCGMAASSSSGGRENSFSEAERARGRTGGSSNYQRQLKGDRSSRGARAQRGGILQTAGRARARELSGKFDDKWGYSQLSEGESHVGFLVTMQPTTTATDERIERSGIDLYFLKQDGSTFKTTVHHEPYFYVGFRRDWGSLVSTALTHKFEGVISGIDQVEMEDLDLANHLSGLKAKYLRLRFRSVSELMDVRNVVRLTVERNRKRTSAEQLEGLEDVSGYSQIRCVYHRLCVSCCRRMPSPVT